MITNNAVKPAVLIHVALVATAVFYVVRIANYTPLAELPSMDMLVFSATAFPPVVAAALARFVLRTGRALRVLAYGLSLGAVLYALSLAMVVTTSEQEPLAPLWLILISLWLAAAYAILLLVLWLWERFRRSAR